MSSPLQCLGRILLLNLVLAEFFVVSRWRASLLICCCSQLREPPSPPCVNPFCLEAGNRNWIPVLLCVSLTLPLSPSEKTLCPCDCLVSSSRSTGWSLELPLQNSFAHAMWHNHEISSKSWSYGLGQEILGYVLGLCLNRVNNLENNFGRIRYSCGSKAENNVKKFPQWLP